MHKAKKKYLGSLFAVKNRATAIFTGLSSKHVRVETAK